MIERSDYKPFNEIVRKHGLSGAPTPAEVPEYLYHYTDAAGLFGMLSSGSLWLTDFRFLNDRTEVYHTETLMGGVLRRRDVGCSDDVLRRLYAVASADMSFTSTLPSLIFSTSEDADDLSQWRGYANNGRGFTIGFRAQRFLDRSAWNFVPDFHKVRYDSLFQTRALELALDAIEKELLLQAKANPEEIDVVVGHAHTALKLIVMMQSTRNKHSSFSAEREWRLTSLFDLDEGDDEDVQNEPLRVRVRGLELVPYLVLKPGEANLPIARIGVGPGLRFDEQKFSIEAMCRSHGLNGVEIYRADSPFRV